LQFAVLHDGENAGEGLLMSWRPELVVRHPDALSVEHASLMLLVSNKDMFNAAKALDVRIAPAIHGNDTVTVAEDAEVRCVVPALSEEKGLGLLRVVCPFPTPQTERAAFRLRGQGLYVFEVHGQVEAVAKLPQGV
jgi:hypothetical protein